MGARERVAEFWHAPNDPHAPQIGAEGYTLPSLEKLEWQPVGAPEDDNWLVTTPGENSAFDIKFRGGHGNVVVLGSGSTLRGIMSCLCNNSTFILGENTGIASAAYLEIHAYGNDALVFFGARSSVNNASFFFHCNDARIVFGEHCMLAHGITVRAGDSHSMIDMTTSAFINPPGPIFVEPHVWVCPEVHLLKGTAIGFGSIVAIKSVISRAFPRFALIGGQPQRVLRSNVSWHRQDTPPPGTRDALAAWADKIVRTGYADPEPMLTREIASA